MSGHSKWATTHHQKAAADAKRSAVFTKLSRLITVAAREKGGDMETNFSLRMLVDKARDASMPKDNIEKAIKKGAGGADGENFEELVYEAIGPFNTQFIIKCLTSNKNRTATNIRLIFSKVGGALSSVAWNFDKKIELTGIEYIPKDTMELNEEQSLKIENIVDMLDNDEDVVNWWGNF